MTGLAILCIGTLSVGLESTKPVYKDQIVLLEKSLINE